MDVLELAFAVPRSSVGATALLFASPHNLHYVKYPATTFGVDKEGLFNAHPVDQRKRVAVVPPCSLSALVARLARPHCFAIAAKK